MAGDDEEEQLRARMTSQELAQMPQLIAENLRYACGEKDCKYITIDDVMLQYHIHALHSTLKVILKCNFKLLKDSTRMKTSISIKVFCSITNRQTDKIFIE